MRTRLQALWHHLADPAPPAPAPGPSPEPPPPPPPPPSDPTGVVPDAPLWDSLVGGTGQFTATWDAVLFLINGSAVSAGPITAYTVRWGLTEASVQEGGTPADTPQTTTSTSRTVTGLASGTWYVSVSATNAAGESSYSFAYPVTVT